MAHFACLEDNTVTQVIVVHNNELLVDGVESEAKGIEFCQSLFEGEWIQTSYNGTIRKNFAGIGFTYDSTLDAFIAPKPDDFTDEDDNTFTFELNEDTCKWEAIPAP